MIKSKIISLANRIHFYALLVLLIYLCFIHYLYIIFLLLYLVYLIKHKFFNLSYFIVIVIFLASFIIRINIKSEIKNEVIVKIEEVSQKETYTKYVASYKKEKVILKSNDNSYIPGDIVLIKGDISDISNFSDFDYKTYLKSQRIYKEILVKESKLIKHVNNVYYLRYLVFLNYSKKLSKSSFNYFNSLILANGLIDDELNQKSLNLGINYMFCVSGFHVSLFIYCLNFLLSKLVKDRKIKSIIMFIILALYGTFTLFTIGVLRSLTTNALKKINQKYNFYLTRLDILSLTFLIMLFINPLYIFRSGFKYSFVTCLFLNLCKDLTNDKNRLISSVKTSFVCFISTIPLVINSINRVNLITFIISPFLLIYLTYIIIPLTFMLLIFPDLNSLLDSPFLLFNSIINKLNGFDKFIIEAKSLNPILISIFYVVFFLSLVSIEEKKSKRNIYIFCSYIIYILFLNINFIPYVAMINVGQGDSFLINDNNKYLVIDSFNSNIDYLKSENVKKIDTLIITHSDNDHIGSRLELVKTFEVNKLIVNKYETSDIVKEMSKYVNRTYYFKANDTLFFNNNKIDFIGPISKSNNINNNSLVFIINFKGVKFLFTGDSEIEEEKEIYKEKIYVDFVKIAHHGSKTSTSSYFMNNVNFKEALISVGENNKYNHPDKEVIDKLNGKIYMTKDKNSVKIYVVNKKYYIYCKKYDSFFLNLVMFR